MHQWFDTAQPIRIGFFKLTTGILFGLLMVGVASLGILAYQKNISANTSSHWLNSSHQALDQIEVVSALSKDVQLESNALFFTGDSAFRLPYANARLMLFEELNRMRIVIRDNPRQQGRIDSLELMFKDMIAFSDSAMLAPEKATNFEKDVLARINVNSAFRRDIGKLIGNLKTEEKELLKIREKASADDISSFNTTFFLMLLAIFALLITTFFSIRFSFNKRVRAELELKKANELFFKLFYESPVGMVISRSADGEIMDCNNAYAVLVNYKREEIVGKKAIHSGIFNGDQRSTEAVTLSPKDGTINNIELSLHPKDKETLWVSISLQSIQIQGTDCVLAAVLDMTSHKRAEEKIKKALIKEMELNKMKSNFVTLASHEFRTPLTAILSSAVLLERYSSDDNQQRAAKHMERIKTSVNNLTLILDECLSLSKIEEDKMFPLVEKLDLKEYLNSVCLAFKNTVKSGQNIEYKHDGELFVRTDPVIIRNIVTNLVSNAIKYSDEGSSILVSSTANSRIHITVKDSGIGIPKDEQKNLFNRFYRASNAGTVQGTGLGLYITKHYVEMLHGSIRVNSELGRGTEVEVILEPPLETNA